MIPEDWTFIGTTAELEEAYRVVLGLERLLGEECAAVRVLDIKTITDLAEQKRLWATELSELIERARTSGAHSGEKPIERRALEGLVRQAADRMVARALANSALLAEAIEVISESLGLGTSDIATYDARARRRMTARPLAGKRAA